MQIASLIKLKYFHLFILNFYKSKYCTSFHNSFSIQFASYYFLRFYQIELFQNLALIPFYVIIAYLLLILKFCFCHHLFTYIFINQNISIRNYIYLIKSIEQPKFMQQNQNLFPITSYQFYQPLYYYPYNIHFLAPIYDQFLDNNFIPNITFIPTMVQIQTSEKDLEEKRGGTDDQGEEIQQKSVKSLYPVLRKKIIRKQIKEELKISNPKKYTQNTKRNFFSNLARLVINFLNSEQKSSFYLSKIAPQVDPDLQKQFYKYIKKFKRNLDTYIKRSSLYHLLGFEEVQIKATEPPFLSQTHFRLKKFNSEKEMKIRQLIRILAKYYLQELLVPIILRSKRMSSHNKWSHLKLRRQLILAFESIRRPTEQIVHK